ncbi:hypothetical protein EJ07DRAFT_185006 [Lizonia empirigonia]|nr:hypothetical protein EJ07DRAFT_185006 [Lizonia empirigonia]
MGEDLYTWLEDGGFRLSFEEEGYRIYGPFGRSRNRHDVVEAGVGSKGDLRLTTLNEFGARGDGKKARKRVRVEGGEATQRRCKKCHKVGHNSRTCKKAAEGVTE